VQFRGRKSSVEIDGIIYNLGNFSAEMEHTGNKAKVYNEALGKLHAMSATLTLDRPIFQSWGERRIYYRRNKWARYQLSDPHKESTNSVYSNEGRMLYGKSPL
jgi:hypothetical protein